jgi:hypothetical protein
MPRNERTHGFGAAAPRMRKPAVDPGDYMGDYNGRFQATSGVAVRRATLRHVKTLCLTGDVSGRLLSRRSKVRILLDAPGVT